MPIVLKIARSAKEIDDALWVRHEVFVVEDQRFGGKPLHDERLVDRYDALPETFNVVAYDGADAIATIRLFKESEIGLPVDGLFDFSSYRQRLIGEEAQRTLNLSLKEMPGPPVFGGAGMLAIRSSWRRRRDVIRAMFRLAATVCRAEGVSHLLLTVNYETAGMYKRLGFETLAEKVWNEEVSNYVAALAAPTDQFFEWAFAGLNAAPVNIFQDSFQRWVLRKGEVIFEEGSTGAHAFVVESGHVGISRASASGKQLRLADLSRGELFGELALVDNGPRSASALAITDTELIALDKETFSSQLRDHPEKAQQLFEIFSGRLRRMDELALMLAYAPKTQRFSFGLKMARRRALPDSRAPERLVFRGGPGELAILAAVDEAFTRHGLEERVAAGELEFSEHQICFLK